MHKITACLLLSISIIMTGAAFADQPAVITAVINEEQSKTQADDIVQIVRFLDELYKDLHVRVKNGEKIVIFFDPAHGIDDDGKWEGEKTGRISSTGLPEEYYSLAISRKLYALLKNNRHIKIVSTSDYIDALEGRSDVYYNITFKETVELAKNAKAVLVISEHLNNTATVFKAHGLANMRGIHVTYNNGHAYLSHIKEEHRGFLTLYNKFDASGFSFHVADRVKDKLVKKGLRANSWDYGTVADDRFTYFVYYPISVMFESGFISNPEDEKMLRNPHYQEIIAQAHYEAIIEAIRLTFGVDISGIFGPKIVDEVNPSKNVTLLKLMRIACYYISQNEIEKGLNVLHVLLEECDPAKNAVIIENITNMKNRIERSEELYHTAVAFKRRGNLKRAKQYLQRAIRIVNRSPVFYELEKTYRSEYRALGGRREAEAMYQITPPVSARSIYPVRSTITKPVIVVLDSSITVRQSLYNALQLDDKKLEKMTRQFNESRVRVGKKRFEKPSKEGIYIVQLTPKGNIKSVKRVRNVRLDPFKYQNHLYLKNAYGAPQEKNKSP